MSEELKSIEELRAEIARLNRLLKISRQSREFLEEYIAELEEEK